MYEALIVIVFTKKKQQKHSHNNLQELWQFDFLSNVNKIYIPIQDRILLVIANILWLIKKCLYLLKVQ